LRRRESRKGSELHDLQSAGCELSAEVIWLLVAQPVPPLGNGAVDSGLRGDRQESDPPGYLSRCHEGYGHHAESSGHAAPEDRRYHVQSERSREVRAVVPDSQPGFVAKEWLQTNEGPIRTNCSSDHWNTGRCRVMGIHEHD